MKFGFIFPLIVCALSIGCTKSSIEKKYYGTTKQGENVDIYTLHNKNGCEAKIISYGGIVVSLAVPDRNGNFEDVVLGFDNLKDYEEKSPYFGALIGRYGNRIGKAAFNLNGQTYSLGKNDHGNTLHGGFRGFDKVVWNASIKGDSLQFTYKSPSGEEGFPGKLEVSATYTLSNQNELQLVFEATTDQPTVCNLTSHSYFNLSGSGTILDHELEIFGDWITPVDQELIPHGDFLAVDGTPFDFRTPHSIGERINVPDTQLLYGKGYDHNWVIQKDPTRSLTLLARVFDPKSGRVLEAFSTEPGIQFYSGNFLDGTLMGKKGFPYAHRSGFCLEPQRFPNSPNVPSFPPTTLEPGKRYRHELIYRFTTK